MANITMKITAFVLALFSVLQSFFGGIVFHLPVKYDMPSANEIVAKFEASGSEGVHPRIYATAADFAAINTKIGADTTAAAWYAKVLAGADSIIGKDLLKHELPDGVRLLSISREALNRMLHLGLVWQLTGNDAYALRAWRELEAISAFPDWNPAHFLDTGEMAHAFAIGYDWLYNYLSAAQKQTIVSAVFRLGIEVAADGVKNKSWWTKTTNNWNPVCNGGIGVACLAFFEENPALCSTFLSHAFESMPIAIEEVAPNGVYPEGPGYWAYGTNYTVYFMANTFKVLGTDYGLSDIKGFRDTGFFPLHINGPAGSFNWGDGGSGKAASPILYWFAARFNTPALSVYQLALDSGSPLSLIWYDPANVTADVYSGLDLSVCLKSDAHEELAVFRSSYTDSNALYAAIKSGWNTSSHTDLDTGTFVLDALGVRWAEDLGGDYYNSAGYWDMDSNGGRWTCYRKRAEGQNTLSINAGTTAFFDKDSITDQYVGAKTDIKTFSADENGGTAAIDMSEAYRYTHYRVTSAVRTMQMFDSRTKIMLKDEIKGSGPLNIYWFMHTKADIDISADGRTATLKRGGKTLLAQLTEGSAGTFTQMAAVPLATSPAPADAGYYSNLNYKKLVVHVEAEKQAVISVVFSPVAGE